MKEKLKLIEHYLKTANGTYVDEEEKLCEWAIAVGGIKALVWEAYNLTKEIEKELAANEARTND